MSDLKAPDVVYVHKDFVDGLFGAIRRSRYSDRDFSYTLTTTAEANTRKTVREALESVKRDVRSQLNLEYEMTLIPDNTIQFIDELLTQYQEVES